MPAALLTQIGAAIDTYCADPANPFFFRAINTGRSLAYIEAFNLRKLVLTATQAAGLTTSLTDWLIDGYQDEDTHGADTYTVIYNGDPVPLTYATHMALLTATWAATAISQHISQHPDRPLSQVDGYPTQVNTGWTLTPAPPTERPLLVPATGTHPETHVAPYYRSAMLTVQDEHAATPMTAELTILEPDPASPHAASLTPITP